MNKSSASVTVGPKRKSSSPACCCRNSSLSPVIRRITDRGSGILAVTRYSRSNSSRLMPRYESILACSALVRQHAGARNESVSVMLRDGGGRILPGRALTKVSCIVSNLVGSIRKRLLQEIKHDSHGLPRRPRQAGLKVPKEGQITVSGPLEHIASAVRACAPERIVQHQGLRR